MNETAALLLGLGLGLRHATDADHVLAVSTLLHRSPGMLRALRVAILWGVGHTVSILVVGCLVVLAGLRLPERFEHLAAGAVACMLVGLGAWTLVARSHPEPLNTAVARSHDARPMLVGMVHGLAGSAGVALLVTATIPSRLLAVVYLGLFGLGTVLGMAALTLLLAAPIRWALRRPTTWELLRWISGGLSIALGIVLFVEGWLAGG